MDILQTLLDLFSGVSSHPYFAYIAVFSVLLLCGFGVPIPEDISLVAGGVMAGLDMANVHIMFLVGLAGVLAGDTIMFVVGRIYGERVRRFRIVARYLTPERYEAVQDKFHKYGNRVMFVARFLPGLRSPIFLTAGMTRRISFWRFIAADGFAALISVPIWVYLGYYGADNRAWLMEQVHAGQRGILLVLAVLLVAVACLWWRKRSKARATLPDGTAGTD
ncbi:DedA family protein [Leeia aquatica]|uniref:DedA family protein n=1 Tax=Leeia aquatica TaxID=2725557 RepID=A0A847RU02_9NEIS|nr:DedA family protein [Leeia aquatica]NLR74690.1 DedA family protein [Leeia aquatica]